MNTPSLTGQLTHEPPANALALPLISRERFAELSGVPDGVLKGWINKGYIPTYSVGKYCLINLALLNQMALQKAPWL